MLPRRTINLPNLVSLVGQRECWTDERLEKHYGADAIKASTENRPKPSMVRGPPRKPKQTGHAVWIGNLPPQLDLMTLVHHVCSVAPGLDSLFYIAKSNCAFANFKDEESCVYGQQKVNDSRLGGGRLLARLRTSRVEGAGGIVAPTGPSGTPVPQAPASDASPESKDGEPSQATIENADLEPLAGTRDGRDISTAPTVRSAKDRYFIIKSLTIEDVELSMQTNIWATQAHNEETLNSAFATADDVFLFFSANKSGSYAGYARMASAINDDPEALVLMSHGARGGDLPRAIPMEASGATPRGYIIDDSARGTIFWEADHEEPADTRRNSGGSLEVNGVQADGGEEGGNGSADAGSVRSEGSKPDLNTWGKPFKVEWISTNPLPFHRTRGMRNPWNNNRDIKVARDGTEVETMLGRKLAALFHRSTPSPAPNMAGGPPPPMAPMMQGGYNPQNTQYQQ
ncbi:YT521-B-like domain-containing protein [Coniochaeta sp. 2T2.1]|nr:YT521-B-like domain-containing protein [Coniochaeta sp. 2T2.1]